MEPNRSPLWNNFVRTSGLQNSLGVSTISASKALTDFLSLLGFSMISVTKALFFFSYRSLSGSLQFSCFRLRFLSIFVILLMVERLNMSIWFVRLVD